MDLTEQIEKYIHEADFLSYTIKKSNAVINGLEGNKELQNFYTKQLMPTIEEYKNTIQALLFLLKQYFDWEKKIKKTRNLKYRRLYKMILKDLTMPVQRA